MINQKDILAALQNGSKAEDIAQAFADALNEAVAKKAAADAKIQKKKEKEADLKEVIMNFVDFLEKWYPDIYDESLRKEVSVESLIKAFDEAYELSKKMSPIISDLSDLISVGQTGNIIIPEVKEDKVCGDPIAEFLRKHSL